MKLSAYFKNEIEQIKSEPYRAFTAWYFNTHVGAWFEKSGASSSGKFHPAFAQGEGGLIRHTKAVFLVCEELLKMNTYAYMKEQYKDFARMACLLHDTCKYGTADEEDKSCYATHGELASECLKEAWHDFFGEHCPDFLVLAVRSHMGQWTQEKDDRPFTNIDRLVHLSDYIASRSFWDIPEISNEYYDVTE